MELARFSEAAVRVCLQPNRRGQSKSDNGADEHCVDHRDLSCYARLTRDGGVGSEHPTYTDRIESERKGTILLVRSGPERRVAAVIARSTIQ